MADFTFDVGGPQGSPIQPMAPIERGGNLAMAEFATNLAGGVANFASDYAQVKREEAKEQLKANIQAQQDSTVAAFAEDQLRLVDATEMGDISSAEARMRMRDNLTRAIANNPALAVDLGKAHTSLIKTSGLGQAVYEGTTAEKQQVNLETKAIEAGWAAPDDSPAKRQEAAQAYVQFQRSIEMMEYEGKQVGLQTAKVGLESAKIGLTTSAIQQQSAKLTLQNKQRQQASQLAIGSAANSYMVKLSNDLERIRQQKEAGTIDATQAAIMADQSYLAVDQMSRQVGAQAGSEYINNVVAPMKMQLDNYKKYMSGEIELTEMETRNNTTVAMQSTTLMSDPRAARIVAASKLFPNSDMMTVGETNQIVLNYIESGSTTATKPPDVLPDYQEGKDGVKTYFNLLGETMGKLNRGVAVDPDAAVVDVNNNLNNILKGVEVYGPTVSSPSDYNAVMDFLSKPETGKFITKQGGFSDQAAAYKAGQALEFEYNNVVLPLIKEEYERTKAGGKAKISYVGRTEVPSIEGQVPTSELIVPKFIGSGIVFTVKEGVNDSFTRNRAKELNNNVSTILNRIIRTTAHLEGTTDYKAVYESKFANLFEAQEKVNDVGE